LPGPQSAAGVIGGGFIGLEVAATASKRGLRATVLEGLDRLMSRVVAPIVSEAAARVHRAHGVQLEFGVSITELVGDGGRVRAVRLADGREFPAGCVVVGVGVNANDELAVAAIYCGSSIIVDVFAHQRPMHRCRRRLHGATSRRWHAAATESVQNAVEQGKSAAAALMGRDKPFTAAPWFWSINTM
jgi:3-phenylpropionate/trans-cinnamate dioxygenase ferredoxin reductase subunit